MQPTESSSAAGNSGLSWPDVLLGSLPNVYVYACNNPSESIIAKRRGYGTIVSHNVPPYGRWAVTQPAKCDSEGIWLALGDVLKTNFWPVEIAQCGD